MTDLIALAERCEQAAGPSRQIDGDIAEALALHPKDIAIRGSRQPELFSDGGPGLHAKTWLAPHFTTSLDAAMKLVPDNLLSTKECDFAIETDRWLEGPNWTARFDWPGDGCGHGETILSTAATPALALCAAALRAHAAKEQSHD